jgi:hypothetical protein
MGCQLCSQNLRHHNENKEEVNKNRSYSRIAKPDKKMGYLRPAASSTFETLGFTAPLFVPRSGWAGEKQHERH